MNKVGLFVNLLRLIVLGRHSEHHFTTFLCRFLSFIFVAEGFLPQFLCYRLVWVEPFTLRVFEKNLLELLNTRACLLSDGFELIEVPNGFALNFFANERERSLLEGLNSSLCFNVVFTWIVFLFKRFKLARLVAKQLQTLLANFDDSSVLGFNLVSQILNPFFLASLVSLSQILFTTGQSSNTAVLDVLLEHFKFLHVLFETLARILPQLGLATARSPGERLRIA